MTTPVSNALAKLHTEFAGQLPERLATIRAQFETLSPSAWQVEQVQTLHRLLHNLTGSAGTFGMPLVSDASRELESLLMALLKTNRVPTGEEWHTVSTGLDHLESLTHVQLTTNAPRLEEPAPSPQPVSTPLIDLVEDDLAQVERLAHALRDDGYRVRVFTTPDALRASYNEPGTERPNAVIMDMVFPEGDSTGASLIAEFGLGGNNGIPVVVTSARSDLPTRLAAFRAGANRYLTKPVDASHLINFLDSTTGRQPHEPYRILLLDDEPLLLEAQATVLRAAGMTVHTSSEPLRVLDEVDDFNPDVIVLDVYMPDATGPELAAVIRECDALLHTPILFLSSETDMNQQLLALNFGGDDFLVKPVRPDHLVAAVTARAQRARQNSATQKRLKTTLYEREREHLALNHHAIVSIADRAGNITYVNDLFCEVSGYSQNELLGQNHRIVKSDRHPPEFYQDLWRTIARGDVWQGEVCNRRKDGSLYWVESTITPFMDSYGKPYQYVSIRTDITHMKKAEEALGIQKERLRRGQLYANIGTWEWNVQNGDLFWSERIAPLFGYPAGDLDTSYENFLAAVHPDDRQAVIDAVNNSVEHSAPYEIEHRAVWPDGTERWLLERGAVSRDDNDLPLQMLGVVQDIDDRKRAELALIERERQLQEAQALARLGNWQANMVTGELVWSDEIYRIFGYEPGSFEPSVDAFNAAVHPDDHGKLLQSEKLSEQTGRHDVVHRIIRPDGEIRHVHELAQAETDAKGKLLRLAGTIQDITEQVEIELQLVNARDEAERANKAKSEFLSSMSHELRTPMNAILGFGQLLEHDDSLDDDQRDSIQEILKAGHHLLELINEVLDLAKVESGNLALSMEPVELCPIIEECLNLVATLASKRDIQLGHSGIKGLAVLADRMRLKQILLNLLSNAIKYNRVGGSVKLEVMPDNTGHLRLLVIDTGKGIPAERINELFQPFNRLDAENSEIEGTGIGLTITQRIVEMMGGSVGVESEIGIGSRFWIELPLASLPNFNHRHTPVTDAVTPILIGNNQPLQDTLLYIEDNPANLKLVAHILNQRKDIHLLSAHTPELGLELARTRQPNLILLDINMPGMDGYQLLEVLKASEQLKNIPVVALTANAMPRDIERGITAGFDEYLTKPLNVSKFLKCIDHLLAGRHENRP